MSNIEHIIDGDTGQEAADKINAVINIVNNLEAGTGWTAETAIVSDGARRVVQIVDWFGGTGDKPDVGQYVGSGGFVTDIAQAIDIRGEEGAEGPEGPQGPAGESGNLLNIVALGNIIGATAIDLSQGNTFTANLTDAITLSFTNVPTGGTGIVLEFTGIEQITFPVGGNAVGGDIPEATGGRYKYILTVRASGDYDVDGLIDDIQSV